MLWDLLLSLVLLLCRRTRGARPCWLWCTMHKSPGNAADRQLLRCACLWLWLAAAGSTGGGAGCTVQGRGEGG